MSSLRRTRPVYGERRADDRPADGNPQRCRIAELCGYDALATVDLLIEVRDCADNVSSESRTHPGGPFVLLTDDCGP